VYCLDWLSLSASSVGIEGLGLVTWSGVFPGSWVDVVLLLLLSLVVLVGTTLGMTMFGG